MKKIAKIVLILLMLATCIFAVTACDKNQNTKITLSISNENMPQTVFVKGNELDLSAGKLTVSGKEQMEISLNAEGVAVTGYDKNAVGSQTLTVTYQGASMTLDVKVVERIAVGDKFTKEYVTGEQFDALSGKLVITKDNGESFDIASSDSKLSFSGFDSQTAGVKNVNVTYKDDQVEYVGVVSVTVYEIDRIQFNKMYMKTDYKSHDTELDLSSGHFVVTAKGGSIQNKYIYLDESMVKTELDTSLVNESNPSAEQIITISFGGRDFQHKIKITLTDVTRIQNAAKSLAVLDWSGNDGCKVADEQGKLAVSAYEMYTKLNDEDKTFISESQLMDVIRPAVVYANSNWIDRASEFSALFEVESNTLLFNCESYEITKQNFDIIDKLAKDDVLFIYGDILESIAKKYGNVILFDDKAIAQYLENVCSGTDVSHAIEVIDLMLKMHVALKDVPAEWELSDLVKYANEIDNARKLAIQLGEVRDPLFERYVFSIVSEWRTSDDYVDILYRYYYSQYLNGDAETKAAAQVIIEDMFNSCMPDIFENFLLQYIDTMMEQQKLGYSVSQTQIVPANSIDTFSFVASFRRLLQIADAIENSEDEMLSDLYRIFRMDDLVEGLQTDKLGIFQILGWAYGDDAFDNMWTKYINTVFMLSADDVSKEEEELAAKDLFETFANLTPELQYQFLASLNPYGLPEFVPSDGTQRATLFTNLFMVYCNVYLSELMPQDDEDSIVFELFDAMQFYLLRDEIAYASEEDGEVYYLELFLEAMSIAKDMYKNLSVNNKKTFDEYLGFLYEKYDTIYALYDANGKFVEQNISDEWKEVLSNFEDMYKVLNELLYFTSRYYAMYPVYISAYEATVDMYNSIIENAPQEVINMLLYIDTDMFEDMKAPYETFLYQYRSIYMSYLADYKYDTGFSSAMIWNLYQSSNLREYFSALFNFYALSMDENGIALENAQYVWEAMNGFRALSDNDKKLFLLMDAYGAFAYFPAVDEFFVKLFDTTAALPVAGNLLNLEIAYWSEEITDEQFISAWESIADAYEALSDEDKALFDDNLAEMFDYYKSMYDELKAEQETA